ncbi:MAG TPA: toast rack family protein [Anaerolineae bacterium]
MKRNLLILVLAGILLLATGCDLIRLQVGPTETETQSVELGDAESVDVNINMGVGELNVSGGAGNLLDATFTFNVDEWRPEVDYDVSGGRGRLTIEQPGELPEGIPDDDVTYRWDLQLSDDVPMDLEVNLGVGESELDLSGLFLTGLTMNLGVGQTTVDLSGAWPDSFDVAIRGGVGETTVRLPRDVGVRVSTRTGIGNIVVNDLNRSGDTYTNDAYDEGADVVLDVTLEGGIGEITLELAES